MAQGTVCDTLIHISRYNCRLAAVPPVPLVRCPARSGSAKSRMNVLLNVHALSSIIVPFIHMCAIVCAGRGAYARDQTRDGEREAETREARGRSFGSVYSSVQRACAPQPNSCVFEDRSRDPTLPLLTQPGRTLRRIGRAKISYYNL